MKHAKLVLLLVCTMLLSLGTALAQKITGNGAPNGPHYNLNILGKTTCPGDDLKDTNRHTIMVKLNYADEDTNGKNFNELDKTNKIFLQEGDFQVIDGNACDGDGATFQLPANPYTCTVGDPNCLETDPTFQNYWVYARALGKPGGSAKITTCAVDPGDNTVECSTENVVLVRDKNKSSFTNVTKELTTLCLDTTGNTICDTRIGIFDNSLEDYFWDYDNYGLRNAQLRFYAIPD